MFEDDRARIDEVFERVFGECKEIATQMRQSNSALNDLGMLNLVKERLKEPLYAEISVIFSENF